MAASYLRKVRRRRHEAGSPVTGACLLDAGLAAGLAHESSPFHDFWWVVLGLREQANGVSLYEHFAVKKTKN